MLFPPAIATAAATSEATFSFTEYSNSKEKDLESSDSVSAISEEGAAIPAHRI
jgi:hypothetical protein